ncbi:hypothetical protein SDB_02687 [Shigella dysenteriae CDC 74-1112]|nr:hypothetical protein SDB_02687 [Shigella dysenteriae CDC 74-1112]
MFEYAIHAGIFTANRRKQDDSVTTEYSPTGPDVVDQVSKISRLGESGMI